MYLLPAFAVTPGDCMDRHVHHPNEPSLVGDPDRFAKAASLLTMTPQRSILVLLY
jgi:hypothetical protein